MPQGIMKQPAAVTDTTRGVPRVLFFFFKNWVSPRGKDRILTAITRAGWLKAAIHKNVRNNHIVSRGTSYHAGLVSRYGWKSRPGCLAQVDGSMSNRLQASIRTGSPLLITLSQSGKRPDHPGSLRQQKAGLPGTLGHSNSGWQFTGTEAELALVDPRGPRDWVLHHQGLNHSTTFALAFG